MKTGEIAIILEGIRPSDTPRESRWPDPLKMACRGSAGNPSPDAAAYTLDWPEPICLAIAAAFDVAEWPKDSAERVELYRTHFDLAKKAGLAACREHDDPGSTF